MILRQEKLNPADFVEDHPLFVNGEQVGRTQERAVGWHASEVIKGVAVQAGLSKEYDDDFAWNWSMLLGLAFEAFFVRKTGIRSASGTIWQPGEMALGTGINGFSPDGRRLGTVYANMDGYSPLVNWEGMAEEAGIGKRNRQVSTSVGMEVPVLEEFKSTEKSLLGEPVKHVLWHMQMKTYLRALSERFGGEHRWARLWCLWLNGDYGKGDVGKQKEMTCWWIEYSQEEIDANWWQMVEWLKLQRTQGKGR